MINCSQFVVHYFPIKVHELNKPISLYCFGDVHRFAKGCAEDKWLQFLDTAKRDPNAYFLGMGDYDDFLSTSEREIMINPKLHDDTQWAIDDIYTSRNMQFKKEIDFMRGRIVGLIEGNHYGIYSTGGMTTTQELCNMLKCRYLGVNGFIRLSFKYGNKRVSIDIFAHHGRGAARLLGSSLNTVEQMMANAEADLYCVDSTTEILTTTGFKKIDEIKKGEKVFSFNLKENLIEEDIAREVIISNYKGKMYHFRNKFYDMLLSPNHRIIYKYEDNWRIKKASEFFDLRSPVRMPMASLYGSGVTLTDAQIALTGWIISEGSFVCSGIRLNQKSEEKFKIIENTIKSCGYKYTKQKRIDGMNVIYILASERKKIDFIKEKNIPDWVYSLNKRQFDIFFKHIVLGDGHSLGNSGTYYSVNEDLINRLQLALCLHGYRSYKLFRKGGFSNGCWVLGWCNKPLIKTYILKNKRKVINYDGKIWCINTFNTTMICRRNGRVFITGNCMGHDHKLGAIKASRLHLQEGNGGLLLKDKTVILGRSGSFLRSYMPDHQSYVVKGAMKPSEIGYLKILMTPIRTRETNQEKVKYIDTFSIKLDAVI